MTLKLPRDVLANLDYLIEKLSKGAPEDRKLASGKLMGYEKSGRITLIALIELAEEENLSLSMYGISGLGRNKSAKAVKKLIELLRKHRKGNALYMETIVEALGETASPEAAPALLELIGIETGVKEKWRGLMKKRDKGPDQEEVNRQEYLALSVLRNMQKIKHPKFAALMGGFLEHSDPLLRWHTIQILVNSEVNKFNEQLQRMATEDDDDMVREAARIALSDLNALPQHLNN